MTSESSDGAISSPARRSASTGCGTAMSRVGAEASLRSVGSGMLRHVVAGPGLVKPSRSPALDYEVRLSEAVARAVAAGAGEPDPLADPLALIPPRDFPKEAQVAARRLSSVVALLREACSSQVLGPWNNFITRALGELFHALYTEQLTTAPVVGGAAPAGGYLENVPYFVEVASLRQAAAARAREMESVRAELHRTAVALEAAGDVRKLRAKVEDLEATVALQEYELEKARMEAALLRERSRTAADERERDLRNVESEMRRWQGRAQEAEAEVARLDARRREQEEVRRAFAGLQAKTGGGAAPGVDGDAGTAASGPAKEGDKLEAQLLLLQNSRIDEYEAALEGAGAVRGKALRDGFVAEMGALIAEISLLERHRGAPPGLLGTARPQTKTRGRGGRGNIEVDGVDGDDGVNLAATASPAGGGLAARLLRPDELRETEGAAAGEDGGDAMDALWSRFTAECRSAEAEQASVSFALGTREMSLAGTLRLVEMIMTARGREEAAQLPDRIAWAEAALEGNAAALGPEPQLRPMLDFFHGHLEDTYGLRPVALVVARSLLVALERYREVHSAVQLFVMQLEGRCEEALWQYALALRRVLSSQHVAKAEDLERLLPVLYPTSQEDERAALLSAYHRFMHALPVAYGIGPGELPVRDLIVEFLAGQLLAKTEPRFKKWFKVLKWKDTHHRNSFRRLEYIEIASKLFPAISRGAIAAGYNVAVFKHGTDKVPLDTLAMLTTLFDASLQYHQSVVGSSVELPSSGL